MPHFCVWHLPSLFPFSRSLYPCSTNDTGKSRCPHMLSVAEPAQAVSVTLSSSSISALRNSSRVHKVFYPCNRCHLATLLENQRVTCGNEVTRVTTIGVFALNIHSTQTQSFNYFSVSLCLRVCQDTACGLRSPGLRGSEVPPSRVGGAASVG